MSYPLYKIIHLTGVFMVMLSLGALIFRSLLDSEEKKLKRFGVFTHGIGLVVVLVSGFGLLAKLKFGFDGWVLGKLFLWFIFGGFIAIVNRKLMPMWVLWVAVLVLGFTAAFLAIMKPF